MIMKHLVLACAAALATLTATATLAQTYPAKPTRIINTR